jgi:hypothetical protein
MPPPTMITSNAIRWMSELTKPQRYEIIRRKYQLIIKYLANFRTPLGDFFVALRTTFGKPLRIAKG